MSDLPPIISKAEARAAGLKRYFTGKPCHKGHVTERRVVDKKCMDCLRERDAERWPARREAQNARRKAQWDAEAAEYRAAKAPEWAAREAARAAGQKTYVSQEPCPNGHVGLRMVERSRCVECQREKARRNARQVLIYGPPMPRGSLLLREAAKAAGLTRYFDGVPCARGHVAERNVSNSTCCQCNLDRTHALRATPEGRTKARQHSINWMLANPKKHRELTRARAERLERATPGWIDWLAVADIYDAAKALTEATGIVHHVDHVVPIKGRNVCGLHVQNNLRVVTAEVNMRKSNLLLEEG